MPSESSLNVERPHNPVGTASSANTSTAGAAPTATVRRQQRDPALRQKIEASTQIQTRGWLLGKPGGTPWVLSRTKRWIGSIGALMVILLSLPLWIPIMLAIKLSSKGPVFFVQQRTGFRGRRFGMYKFRTMVVNAEELKESLRHLNKHGAHSIDFKIDDDPRVTRIGRWLRKTSLDELPNLINVVRGEMRLVGPRPTSFHANRYGDGHLRRLTVYPGMTGLWQISGRSDVDFDDRVVLDTAYIEGQGPWMDLKILVLTPIRVLGGKGAS
ncbi:MAG: sugar transferase [Gammaproteobacteria bacterium]|nr:sugar transferase [Gammaproteobacteria bacterium]